MTQRWLVGWLAVLFAIGPIEFVPLFGELGGPESAWLSGTPAHARSTSEKTKAKRTRAKQTKAKRAKAQRAQAKRAKAKRAKAKRAKAKRAKAKRAKAKRARARRERARKRQRARRRRASARRVNMPPGWQWPPSEQMKRDGERCLDHLDELSVAWKKAGKTRKVATPIVVPDMTFGAIKLTSIFRKPPFVMDCHLAEALAVHGQLMYDQGVRELRFSSIHSYRTVRRKGYNGNALSRHALGLAMDIYEFVLDDGRTLVVEKDYHDDAGAVLREVENAMNVTGAFRTLLTPGSDPRSHYDHFHFEARMPQPRTAGVE